MTHLTDRCFLAVFLGNIKKPGVQSLRPPLMHFLKYFEYATYIKCFRAIVSTFYNLLLHLYLFPIKIPMSYYYFTKGLQTNKKIMVQGYGSLVQVYSKKITSARSILISAQLIGIKAVLPFLLKSHNSFFFSLNRKKLGSLFHILLLIQI